MTGEEAARGRFEKLRRKAEKLLETRPDLKADPSMDLLELIHELSIHQAELEVQNENLRETQLELADLKEEFEELYEFAPVGYLVLSPKGVITRANLTASLLLKTPRDILQRTSLSSHLNPQYTDAWYSAMQRAGQSDEAHQLEAPLKRTGNGDIWTKLTVEAVKRESETEVSEWRVVLENITQRVEAEQERERLREQLFQAQKMEALGQLAGGVAHDLNNKLAGILGHIELAMLDLDENNPLLEDLETVEESVHASAEVISRLLGFARRQIIVPQAINPGEVIEELRDGLRQLAGENAILKTALDSNLWEIRMDARQVEQMLANLVINSREAIEERGTITVRASNLSLPPGKHFGQLEPPAGDYVLIIVEDDGGGIPEEMLDRVFEPFFTTKHKSLGAGLGLATVYGIVKQNEGYIIADSRAGKGFQISILLPRHA